MELADSNDAATREAVYHHPDRPAAFIALLARAGVYAEASTEPGETWHDWNGALVGGTGDVVVRPAIPPDPTLPFADFAFLLGRGEFARSVVARHPSTPPDVLVTLLEDPKPSVRVAAAKHPQLAPLAITKAVEADADPALVRALAENPSFLPELIARLATSCHPDLREEAAKQSRDPVTLEALAADPSLGVTFEVARSLFAPPSALRRLAAHPSQHIRKLVAGNPNAPADALEALARDADFYVPIEVAKNPSSPPAAFEALPHTKPISVEVAKNQHAPSAARARAIDLIVACDDWLLRSDLARAPSTPPSALARLALDKTHRVREALASNPAAPDHLLRTLADDPDGRVRRAVGENRACPPDLIRRLAEDPDVNVRHGVAGSPHLPKLRLAPEARMESESEANAVFAATFEALLKQAEPAANETVGIAVRHEREGKEIVDDPNEALLSDLRKACPALRKASECRRRKDSPAPQSAADAHALILDIGPINWLSPSTTRVVGGFSRGYRDSRAWDFQIVKRGEAWVVHDITRKYII